MNLFGRKSAGRAPARPALARSFPWNVSDIPRSYEAQVRSGMLDNPVAQRAVRLVSESVGGAPLYGSDDALTELVKTSSAGQSLLETVAAQLLLHGNGFIQILAAPDGSPRELYALRPERVSVEGDARGWPVAFNYRANGASTRLPADSIIHIKAMHPLDDHYGLGNLGAASGAIAIHNAATLWNKALLDNAARPSGALVYDAGEALSADQFDRLQAELEASFSGAGNAGRPMLLEGGLKWQALSLSPTDMDFIGLKAVAAREIALAFGVPPVLLGLPGDATYSNYREANRALWRQTVLPLAGKILAAIRQGLAVSFPGATLAVDLDGVTELAEDRERLWAQLSGADFLSLDEKRAMIGLGPVDFGDSSGDALLGVPPSGSGAGQGTPNRVSPSDPSAPETKYNHNHDPANGQFTSGPGGGVANRGTTGDRAGNASLTILPPLPKPYDPFTPRGANSDPFTENRRLVPPLGIDPTAPQPPGNRNVSPKGIDLIANLEGPGTKPYVPQGDKSGVTIGYGYDIGSRTADKVISDLMKAGVDRVTAIAFADGRGLRGEEARQFAYSVGVFIKITDAQAKALLPQTIRSYAANVDKLVKAPLNQNQFDALVSLSYNHPLTAKSDIIKLLNQGKYPEAADRFGDINKVTIKNTAGRSVKVVSKGLVRRRAAERQHFLGE